MHPRQTPSPISESTEEDEDILYGDRDGAQSFIQPAISPIATRLTSPRTPAAERAAAMERLQGEASFDGTEDQESLDSMLELASTLPRKPLKGSRGGGSPLALAARPPKRSQTVRAGLPAPWHPGPKQFVVEDSKPRRPPLTGVFGSASRPQRAASMGENALRRLSKAFDSVNMPNFTSSSFFSSNSTQKDGHPVLPSAVARRRSGLQKASLPYPEATSERSSLGLKRTISDNSALYHSLSRVSSFGEDDRFTHIREQVNVRLKAIKDSFDPPNFKMPSRSKPRLI